MRTFGVERAAKADLAVSSPAAQAMLEAYAAGVNAFIETTASLPVEYRLVDAEPEPWQAWHCLAVYKVRNMLMGTFEMKLWRARLALALSPERAASAVSSLPGRWPGVGATRRDLRRTRPRLPRRPRQCGRRARLARGGTTHRTAKRRDRRRQQRLGGGRGAYGLGIALGRRRLPPRTRHAQRLLPGPHQLPELPLLRLRPSRCAGDAALQPQRGRGLGHDPRLRGLPGPLHRTVPPDERTPGIRLPGRLAGCRDNDRDVGRARRHRRGAHRGAYSARSHRCRRTANRPRPRLPPHRHRAAVPRGPIRSTSYSLPGTPTRPRTRCGSGPNRSTTSSTRTSTASSATGTGAASRCAPTPTPGRRCRAGRARTSGRARSRSTRCRMPATPRRASS